MPQAFSCMGMFASLPKDGGWTYLQSLHQAPGPLADRRGYRDKRQHVSLSYILPAKSATSSMTTPRLLASSLCLHTRSGSCSPALSVHLSKRLPHLVVPRCLLLNICNTGLQSLSPEPAPAKQGLHLGEWQKCGLFPGLSHCCLTPHIIYP